MFILFCVRYTVQAQRRVSVFRDLISRPHTVQQVGISRARGRQETVGLPPRSTKSARGTSALCLSSQLHMANRLETR